MSSAEPATPLAPRALPARLARPPSETFNLVTHGAGALAALAGLVWLVMRAESAGSKAAFAVYGVSLVALFTSSTLHHTTSHLASDRQLMRRLDHVAIYLLIAGSYTPVCALAAPRSWGVPVLAAVWAFGAVGIALKLLRPFTSRWVTIGLYVAMGWACIFAIGPMTRVFPFEGLMLLLAGGLTYTGGAVVYAMQKPDLWPRYVGFHGVWHVLVLVAAAFHFVFMVAYVPTA